MRACDPTNPKGLRPATDLNLMNLIAIIPRLPPVVDGIGDYALCLARLLRDNVGITTRFIVTDPAWTGAGEVEGFEVRRMTSHSTDELLNLLAECPSTSEQVVLHYEGYGYAQRGCPIWLVTTVEKWRRENTERRLVTIFHELYAKGPPWTSSFWLSPLQKSLTTRLARLSDQWLTSLERYALVVQKMSGKESSKPNHIAVFSSIGEPQSASPLNERRRRLVVFGTRGRRVEVYKRSATDLNRICEALGIEEIVDIGRPVDFDISSAMKAPVVTCGELPGSEVSEICLDSVAGVIDYPASMLGKSTIFAAYCSHRMIPIVAGHGDGRFADGLEAGVHYWLTSDASEQVNMASGQLMADRAFEWYQSHNLSAHARRLAACLSPCSLAIGS
jgi:hypothetical protein